MRKPRRAHRPMLDIDALLAEKRRLFGDARMEDAGGGDGGAGGAGDGGAGAAGDASAAGGDGAGAGAGSADWDGNIDSLPPAAQKVIRDLRKEAGDNRVAKNTAEQAAEQRTQDMARALAKAAGIELPDDKVDPEKLQKLLEEEQAKAAAKDGEARVAKIELAVLKGAPKHQADADALLDSRGFLTKIAELDPTAEDFAAKIDAAIKEAIKDNPKLKAGRAPGASGADHAGGSGEGAQRTPKPLEAAVAGHYGTA